MSIFVLLPTYNEKENLPLITVQIFAHLPEANILVVDDASPDGTGDLAESLAKKYPEKLFCLHRQGPRGYGPAAIDGFRWVLNKGAEKIIQMDADLSHPPDVLPQLIQMSDKVDMVLGSRYVEGAGTPDWPLGRKILSRGANIYARNILGLSVRDITTGFRCFNRRVIETLNFSNINCKGYGFLTEVVFQVSRLGFSIGEFPIIFRDRILGESKMGLSIAWEGAVNVLRMRLKSIGHKNPSKAIKVEI